MQLFESSMGLKMVKIQVHMAKTAVSRDCLAISDVSFTHRGNTLIAFLFLHRYGRYFMD